MISVVYTVGPNPKYKEWLDESIESVAKQSFGTDNIEIVVVDDAAHLSYTWERNIKEIFFVDLKCIRNQWRLGQAASQNIAVVNAKYDLIYLMGGCDDNLAVDCLQSCYDEYKHRDNKWAFYHPTIITTENEIGTLPQGTGLFHRSMWYKLGGNPLESISEVDAIFTSIMLKQGVVMYPVLEGIPLYIHREWNGALTHSKSSLRHEAAGIIRTMCTLEWEEPYWVEGYKVNVV